MTDTITLPRAAVKKALEALWTAATPQAEDAITALRAALAEPTSENSSAVEPAEGEEP
jgi:hypothetical protein